MALPTFEGFSLQDSNFITERITFRGYAERSVIQAKINRREGVKILANEFGGKEVVIEGIIVADTPSALQLLIDNFKKELLFEEGDLVIENGRTYRATVQNIGVADEHYNQTRAPYEITFLCSDPFSEGVQVSATIPIPSGVVTISGTITISGIFPSRPTITFTPGAPITGNTNIQRLDLYNVQTGQTITISGFGSGTRLSYADPVTFDMDTFLTTEGGSAKDNTGSFSKFDPGVNQFTLTANGGSFPGGSLTVAYKPRYI